MYIAIYAPGMPFNGDTITMGKSLGGSETAAFYMARELAALGHNVVIFTNEKKTGRWDGVKYEWLGDCTQQCPLGDRWHYVMQTPYDIAIAQRHPHAFLHHYNTKVNIWWLHDLALHRNNPNIQSHLINIDRIFTVSEFHKEQVAAVYDLPKEYIYATKNGIDYSFKPFTDTNENRIPRSLIFAARPERGLENLVGEGGIMEQLTDCHLYVAGYDNTTAQMRTYYSYLWNRCIDLPNVTNLGALGKEQLYNYLRSMMLYVYPTTFKDTSCILAMEAQACGLPFIGPKIAALPETLRSGGASLIPLKANGEINKNKFIKTIRGLLDNENAWRGLHKRCKNIKQPWADIAEDWTQLFFELLEKKSITNKRRLFYHFEENSDIIAMMKAGATEESYPSLKNNYEFLLKDTFKDHYRKYYEYEKSRGVIYGPETLEGNARFECTCTMIKEIGPKTILDYGCAHGHYVINCALRFPDIQFVGVDLEQSNIDKAVAWAKEAGVDDRCRFYCADIEKEDLNIPPPNIIFKTQNFNRQRYEMILCQELLEHVKDPRETVIKLSKHLDDGGKFIISVPYGPWEAQGYALHPGWRAHIHMLERADLYELFGEQTGYKIMALPYKDTLGHYLVRFGMNDDKPLGQINYARKIRQQAPRQTLSVCMIVKDGEHDLGRTLKSVKSIATEIIIGLDKTTTDNTKRVAEEFGAQVFEIDSPLEIGFDAARNLTIERAVEDWILWIDSDEIFVNGEGLRYYLRDNPYDGYAIKQHHYATEPAALFKTDLPVRIFRNNRGMKFFGIVHEHPEFEFNTGPGKIIVLNDCAIMHTGYYTEEIRRRRFNRNFPLMLRDREKYPERRLGIFLWARDLAHYIKYTLERNGGHITPEIIEQANTIIDTWRVLLKNNDQRMILDGLPYYTEAVKLLGSGVNYRILVDSAPMGREMNGTRTIEGTFIDTNDIKALTDMLVKNKLSIYEETYY